MRLPDAWKTKEEITRAAMEQCARDCCCSPDAFLSEISSFHKLTPFEGRRRDLPDPFVLGAISFGPCAVLCADTSCEEAATEVLSLKPAWRIFEPEATDILDVAAKRAGNGPMRLASCFLPDLSCLVQFERKSNCTLRVLEPKDLASLEGESAWDNALCQKRKELDMLGVGAYGSDGLLGLAGCSADGEMLWQIGIDVKPAYRKHGIAADLVNLLACEILNRGKVPFYSAAWSNLLSVKTATAAGFRPAWIQMWAP